jgi:8-oxo-dGTP pyrophosphatase MutT (NUDIX family)
VLVHQGRFLLVVHHGKVRDRWGLPGGHIDRGEAPEAAVRRELLEELYIEVGPLRELGDYRYRGHAHRIYTAPLPAPIERFDRYELRRIGWYSRDEVAALGDARRLHAGYEIDVVNGIDT